MARVTILFEHRNIPIPITADSRQQVLMELSAIFPHHQATDFHVKEGEQTHPLTLWLKSNKLKDPFFS